MRKDLIHQRGVQSSLTQASNLILNPIPSCTFFNTQLLHNIRGNPPSVRRMKQASTLSITLNHTQEPLVPNTTINQLIYTHTCNKIILKITHPQSYSTFQLVKTHKLAYQTDKRAPYTRSIKLISHREVPVKSIELFPNIVILFPDIFVRHDGIPLLSLRTPALPLLYTTFTFYTKLNSTALVA